MIQRTRRMAMLLVLLVIVFAMLVFFASRVALVIPLRPTSARITIPALLSARQQTSTAVQQINLAYRKTNDALRLTNNVVYGGTLTREAEQTKILTNNTQTPETGK